MKDSFVFHKEWRNAISGLPKEVRLEVYDAIIEYGISGTLTDLKPMARLAFDFVKAAIDKDNEAYDAKCRKNRENGKKGGRPPKKTENRTVFFKTQKTERFLKEKENEEKDTPPTPPIEKEDKEKENSPHVDFACACGGKDLQSEVADLLHDVPWCEQVCMYFHLKVIDLPLLLQQFVANCQIGGMTSHSDINDAKRHFRDWLIKKQKQDARPYNTSTAESRAADAAAIVARLAATE